jgi:hypothetical protein
MRMHMRRRIVACKVSLLDREGRVSRGLAMGTRRKEEDEEEAKEEAKEEERKAESESEEGGREGAERCTHVHIHTGPQTNL